MFTIEKALVDFAKAIEFGFGVDEVMVTLEAGSDFAQDYRPLKRGTRYPPIVSAEPCQANVVAAVASAVLRLRDRF
jgi:hypothetical protein